MRHHSAWLPLLVAGAISLGHSPAATPPDTLRVAFVGDVMLDRGVRQSIERHGVDALFAPEIDSLFRRCGRVVANLECPATRIRRPVHKRFIFRAEPEWLAGLRRHGVTHLNLANNHTMDQGREGLRDTRRQVLRHGMAPFGMDSTADAACRPLLLAESPRRVIAAGADCLVGHHTHTAQPSEWVQGRPVFYGLGNFIFDPVRPLNAAAWLLRMDVTRDTIHYRLHPIRIIDCTPRLH